MEKLFFNFSTGSLTGPHAGAPSSILKEFPIKEFTDKEFALNEFGPKEFVEPSDFAAGGGVCHFSVLSVTSSPCKVSNKGEFSW